MLPFAFTSERKFVPSTACPLRDLVCETSAAFTARLPLVSPHKIFLDVRKFLNSTGGTFDVVGGPSSLQGSDVVRQTIKRWRYKLHRMCHYAEREA